MGKLASGLRDRAVAYMQSGRPFFPARTAGAGMKTRGKAGFPFSKWKTH